MATITAITRQYAKAVFLDLTRTLNSVPDSQKQGVKEHAAATYYIEDIQQALDAEKITETQYDEVFALNPDMENRPVWNLGVTAGASPTVE
ncbi:hypothetical protein SAMN05216312_1227 [Cohnella sp. OV330]|uniref:hypothetical protein n=1 Tax=Cohnella sp. OV330 TaxID=1855288 RepID=UPI0008E1D672|nr:hypothetical protein [Cohnella sp. OV330]SFB62514.1 hypothetical protein SAMN05216312_1227 [Cohnella sp. OV330]